MPLLCEKIYQNNNNNKKPGQTAISFMILFTS